ncbi:hypothetical protein [Phormidesmis sp. 146-33]
MSRKGESITLSVTAIQKEALEALALQLGYTFGDRPNISKLVGAIADGDLVISRSVETETTEKQGTKSALIKIRSEQAKDAIAKIQQGLEELSNAL